MADESLKKTGMAEEKPVKDNPSESQNEDAELYDTNGTDEEDEDAMATALSGKY